jgi:hypothetical protein
MRDVGWPLAICAGALAAVPLFTGLPLPSLGRVPAPPAAPPAVRRSVQEVYVANAARGCRWQTSTDPAVQIADCGDETDAVRVVFRDGQVAEYRVVARQDPSRSTAAAQNASLAVSVQQPSQPGRIVPTMPPLRVTPEAK